MATIVVTRNGETKLRVPNVEVRNGILRAGKNILINSDLIPAGKKEWVAAEIKAKRITPEIEAMGIKLGDNGNGLVARWAEDIDREQDAKRKADYDALPTEVRACREERIAIDRLFAAAYKSEHRDTDDNQYMRACHQNAEARERLAAWKAKYPKEYELERAERLRLAAEKEDDLASGALVYDADGWFGPAEQQKRHDAFKANAAAMRAEADGIEEATRLGRS
jgi:hypothetical protein